MLAYPVFSRQTDRSDNWEDSPIPIRTLYVNAVNNYPAEARLVYTLFFSYGQIHNVHLHPSKVFFFITYKDSASATKVLNKRGFFRKKFGFFVRPADQWHQPLELPDGTVVWNRTLLDAEVEEEPFEPEIPSMMMLNNDCLMQIFENLSLRELLRLELVNKRMRLLSLTRWSRVTHLDFHEVFPWNREMSLPSFRELLLRCGSALTSLDMSQLRITISDRAFVLIGKHCPNLKRLSISGNEVKIGSWTGMREIVSQLEYIKMEKCIVHNTFWEWFFSNANVLTEFHAHILGLGPAVPEILTAPMENIRILHMDRLHGCLVKLLEMHPHLEDLLCLDLKVTPSSKIKENKLKRLTILSQIRYLEDFLMNIWPQLSELESFSMTCDVNTHNNHWHNFMPNLPNSKKLKELSMHHWPIEGPQLLAIGSMLNGQLTKFSFHGCEMIDDDDIIRFLVTQPNLEYLDVSQGETSFSFPIPELKNYVNRRLEPTPLTVVVDEDVESDEPLLKFVVLKNECSQCVQLGLPFGDLDLEFDPDGDMIRILNPHVFDPFYEDFYSDFYDDDDDDEDDDDFDDDDGYLW